MVRYGDNPIRSGQEDSLGRSDDARQLATLLMEEELDCPIVVGVLGGWGTGKTSVLNIIADELDGHAALVKFDAWRFSGAPGSVWRALIFAISNSVVASCDSLPDSDEQRMAVMETIDHVRSAAYASHVVTSDVGWRVDYRRLVPFAVSIAAAFVPGGKIIDRVLSAFGVDRGKSDNNLSDLMGLIDRVQETETFHHMQSVEQFDRAFQRLIELWLTLTGHARVVLLIDDLDRCDPDEALEVLEALRLFVTSERVATVLGLDPRIVDIAVAARYRDAPVAIGGDQTAIMSGREYIRKIIQVPFVLRPLTSTQMRALARSWQLAHGPPGWLQESVVEIVLAGAGPNPREVKRCLNLLGILYRSAESHPEFHELDPLYIELLAKIAVIQVCHEDVYRRILASPLALKELDRSARADKSGSSMDLSPDLQQALALGHELSRIDNEFLVSFLSGSSVSGQSS